MLTNYPVNRAVRSDLTARRRDVIAVKRTALLPIMIGVLSCGTGSEALAEPKALTDPSQGAKTSPTFQEADKDGDHYVTKQELAEYPNLLNSFDKADAGKTGRLEQHEYQNLIMENMREGNE
jgi:hypothetical protein